MRIYFGEDKLRIPAEKACNAEAVKRGFKDWWDWYNTETKDPKNMAGESDSFKFCLKMSKIKTE